MRLRGPGSAAGSIAIGALAGLAGLALWLALLLAFASRSEPVEAWTPTAFTLRLFAAAVLVPLIEELLMRGWLLRACIQWQEARSAGSRDPLGDVLDQHSIHQLAPGAWTWTAVALSTLIFAAGHAPGEWPAALAWHTCSSVVT